MKIKKTSQTPTILTIGLLLCGVLAVSFLLQKKNAQPRLVETQSAGTSYDQPTVIEANQVNYQSLIATKEGLLYDSDELSIYLVTNVGIPKLIYLYKNDLSGRKRTDNFFLHVHLKNNQHLDASQTFVNLDFTQKPESLVINGKQYYAFIQQLKSGNYVLPYVHPDNIKHINTGRFRPKEGRSLDLKNLIIPEDIVIPNFQSGVPNVVIRVKKKSFEKIKQKRQEALKKGVLTSSDEDLVPGTIFIENQKPSKIDFRLKGDWPDHLRDEKKWSFRVISKGDNTVRGMRKFSIQNPSARGLLWEWLFNKVIKDEDLVGLRYDFVNLNLLIEQENATTQTIEVGLMAWEEAFDKILIENNKKREGLILAFDESLYWSDQEREKYLKLSPKTYSKPLRDVDSAPIKVFNQGKILADPALKKQLTIATEMLEGLRKGEYMLSDVFDVDKLSTFVALTNLFGGSHGLVWHNIRIYYNPITNKFEPISFDSNSGVKLDKIYHYPFSSEQDTVYHTAVLKKLKEVSGATYVNDFINKHHKELNALQLSFITEYAIPIDLTKLEYNSNFIKKYLNPGALITSHLDAYSSNALEITITNLTSHDVSITGLQHQDSRILHASSFKPTTIPVDSSRKIVFPLDEYFNNAFVSKKNKKGAFQITKDYKKLRITHAVKGVAIPRYSVIQPLPKSPDYKNSMALYKKDGLANYDQFPFIKVQENTLLFIKGEHTLDKDLIIPTNYTVQVQQGFALNMTQGASIKSQSPVIANGSPENPIRFYSSDSSGGGLFITNANEQSTLSHCIFDNLSNPQSVIWSVSGAVNFHESDVVISNTTFKNNRCEDALNIIRSSFSLTDSTFIETQSDSFDGDFVQGTIQNCTFINSGNDGIDVSGSQLTISDITITNPSDKGISAGENSNITGNKVYITGGEIGVVSKDLSRIELTELAITGTRLGLSAFQKKSEYGVAAITINNLKLADVEVDHLIEVRSSLMIDNQAVETVSNNVIDQMYGNEYGKSSK